MVLDLVAEFVMGRVCQGPSLSWAEFFMGRDVPESIKLVNKGIVGYSDISWWGTQVKTKLKSADFCVKFSQTDIIDTINDIQ